MNRLSLKMMLLFFPLICSFGCSDKERGNQTNEIKMKHTAVYRAYVRYPYRSTDPSVFDDGGSSFIGTQIYCTLFEQTAHLDIKESLVGQWSLDDSRKTYSFKLRDDVYFSNGRKITADDVVFSLKRLLNKNSVVYVDFAIIKDVIRTSRTTFDISLKEPFPMFLYFLTTVNAAILPKDELLAKGGSFFKKPIGCGPFMLEGFDGNKIVLISNDKAVHKPHIERLEFYYSLSVPDAIRMFNEGLLDDISMAWFNPSLVELKDSKVVNSMAFQVYFIMLHKEKGPFSDVVLRKLFMDLFDREGLMKTIADDRLEAANGLIPRGIVGFNLNERLYRGKDINDVASIIKKLKSKVKLPVDIVLTVSDLFDKMAFEQAISSNGIDNVFDIKLELAKPETVMNRYYERYGDAILMGDDLRYPDPYLILRYFKSDNPYNDVYVKSKAIDDNIDKAILEGDKYKRAQIYQLLEKEIEKEAVILPLFYGDMASGVIHKNVSGYEKPYGGEDYIRYYDVWRSE